MSESRPTSTRRRALKYAGLTGLSGVAGLTGLSLTSQPALALSESVTLPSGLTAGTVNVSSYELQYAELDTASDVTITYILRTASNTLKETHTVPITEPTGTAMTGDHSISVPAGEVSLEVQLKHPSVGTVSTQESTPITVASAIPTSGMFQDPRYQFYAGALSASDGDSPVSYPEALSGLSDASAVGGPTFQSGFNGFDSVFYDGSDDGHDWDGQDGSVSGQTYSVAMLLYVPSDSSQNSRVLSWGSNNYACLEIFSDGRITVQANNVPDPSPYGSLPTGQFATVGFSNNSGSIEFYINGSNVGSDSLSTNADTFSDGNIGIGYHRALNDVWTYGYIPEIIISNSAESSQAFADYHTDRLG